MEERKIEARYIAAAREAIERDDDVIYDVAANEGQIVGNVKHMKWFLYEVALWLQDEEG